MRAREILGGTATVIGIYVFIWIMGVSEGYAHPPITEMYNGIAVMAIVGTVSAIIVAIINRIRNR